MGNPTIDPTKKARRSNQEPLRQEREKMQKPPQIIVIPQSMLAGQKSLLRLAPSPMPRNTSPPPLLQPSPCCSSGGEQETSSIPVTQRFPPGHKGGKKRKMPMKRQQGRGPPWTTSAPRKGC